MTSTHAHSKQANTEPIRSLIPARLDRLGWSRFHTMLVIALGVAWAVSYTHLDVYKRQAWRDTHEPD